MRLGLSSAAAPDASLDELLEGCARRGLSVLELCDGDAHGVDPLAAAPVQDALQRRAAAAGVALGAFRPDPNVSDEALVELSWRLGVTVLLDRPVAPADRVDRAARLVRLGGRAAVVVAGKAAADESELAVARDVQVAWDADPTEGAVGEQAGPLLNRLGSRLVLIRLRGGGPESLAQAGQGIGELMGRLALSGYAGDIVLAPTSHRNGVAWRTWLQRGGGWGCGSKSTALPLVAASAPGAVLEETR